jgi:hypothetical protein
MTLTVGTTLRNNEIVIEAILHQSDFGVTYQAMHVSLNRPLVLQSFNEALRQRGDFEQLRQKFLQDVLVLSKQPSDTVAVIDCFEENGMPFVVLTSSSDCAVPHLNDWLEIPLEETAPIAIPAKTTSESQSSDPIEPSDSIVILEAPSLETPSLETPSPETPSPDRSTEAATLAAALAAAFPEPPESSPTEPKVEELVLTDAAEMISPPADPTSVPIAASAPQRVAVSLPEAQPLLQNGVKLFVSEPAPKPRKVLPLALLVTALITGFGGLGLGLALRFQPAVSADNSSRPSSGWFGREQNFPPQQEWPITETPNLYPPSSTFEQPLYQSSPSPLPDYSSPYLPPSTSDYIPPAQTTAPAYSPPPDIADYPPITPRTEEVPAAPIEAPPPVEPPQEVPLPDPVTPDAPLDITPPASPKDAPPDAPIIFQQ